MLDENGRKKVWAGWQKDLAEVRLWEAKVGKSSLSTLSGGDFIKLWKEMGETLLNFWTNVVVPELANFGGDRLLEEEIRKYVKSETEVSLVMESLTAPAEPSFYREEEMDLLKSDNLSEHIKRYFWLENSYNETRVLIVDDFAKRKKELNPSLA